VQKTERAWCLLWTVDCQKTSWIHQGWWKYSKREQNNFYSRAPPEYLRGQVYRYTWKFLPILITHTCESLNWWQEAPDPTWHTQIEFEPQTQQRVKMQCRRRLESDLSSAIGRNGRKAVFCRAVICTPVALLGFTTNTTCQWSWLKSTLRATRWFLKPVFRRLKGHGIVWEAGWIVSHKLGITHFKIFRKLPRRVRMGIQISLEHAFLFFFPGFRKWKPGVAQPCTFYLIRCADSGCVSVAFRICLYQANTHSCCFSLRTLLRN